MAKRTCPKCQKTLHLEGFAKDKTKASGLKSWCKRCDRAKSRTYYQANRERVIARVLRRERERAAT